jgi:hypothetical protein
VDRSGRRVDLLQPPAQPAENVLVGRSLPGLDAMRDQEYQCIRTTPQLSWDLRYADIRNNLPVARLWHATRPAVARVSKPTIGLAKKVSTLDEEMHDLRSVKDATEDEILVMPGVTGVDIGYKEVAGKRTETLAIRVLVEEKKNVSPDQMIPREIEGLPTDVIQRGTVKFMADTTRYDPLLGGGSIGTCWGAPGTGTLGVIVQDNTTGQLMGLSNWHVLVYGVVGDIPVTQPGPADGGRCPSDVIGHLAQSAINEFVDCAVTNIANRTTEARIAGYIGYVHGSGVVSIGDRIKKQGRTSGLTYGDIDTLDATFRIVDYAGTARTFRHQIGIWRAHGVSDVFIMPGDSGSVFVNYGGQVAGLLFAGSTGNPFLPDGAYGYANPIAAVLDALNIRIAVPPKGKEKDKEKEKEKTPYREKMTFKEKEDHLVGDLARDKISIEAQFLTADPTAAAGFIGPMAERLDALEASVDELRHFISERDRPDLSLGAFQDEAT